jgi:hypothetical protein
MGDVSIERWLIGVNLSENYYCQLHVCEVRLCNLGFGVLKNVGNDLMTEKVSKYGNSLDRKSNVVSNVIIEENGIT